MRARNVFSGLAVAAALAAVNPPVQAQNRESGATVEEQFTLRLIEGPGAFVVTADGRAAFADAVRRKLVLEIAGGDGARVAAN